MFVVATDFDFIPYQIPDLQKYPNAVTAFINKVEKDFLISLLGYSFYKQMVDGLSADPIAAKWTLLKDGGEYTVDSVVYYYGGLRQALIPLVYSMLLRATFDEHTNLGIVIAAFENSEGISPSARIARAFNKYSELCGGSEWWLNSCMRENNLITLHTFLADNSTTYPAYNFVSPGTMNIYNI